MTFTTTAPTQTTDALRQQAKDAAAPGFDRAEKRLREEWAAKGAAADFKIKQFGQQYEFLASQLDTQKLHTMAQQNDELAKTLASITNSSVISNIAGGFLRRRTAEARMQGEKAIADTAFQSDQAKRSAEFQKDQSIDAIRFDMSQGSGELARSIADLQTGTLSGTDTTLGRTGVEEMLYQQLLGNQAANTTGQMQRGVVASGINALYSGDPNNEWDQRLRPNPDTFQYYSPRGQERIIQRLNKARGQRGLQPLSYP